MDITKVYTDSVVVVGRHRTLDPDKVQTLAGSMKALGLQQPISVWIDGDDVPHLVAGLHRLEAAKVLGWEEIDASVVSLSSVDREKWEIAENLHRAELTALERDEHVARWIELSKLPHSAQFVQNESKRADKRGHRKEGGRSAASREIGVNREDARRAEQVAALAPEAKAAAREVGLDDNRSALLKAAKETTPEKQASAIRSYSNEETKEQWLLAIMRVWNRGSKEWREEFLARVDEAVMS